MSLGRRIGSAHGHRPTTSLPTRAPARRSGFGCTDGAAGTSAGARGDSPYLACAPWRATRRSGRRRRPRFSEASVTTPPGGPGLAAGGCRIGGRSCGQATRRTLRGCRFSRKTTWPRCRIVSGSRRWKRPAPSTRNQLRPYTTPHTTSPRLLGESRAAKTRGLANSTGRRCSAAGASPGGSISTTDLERIRQRYGDAAVAAAQAKLAAMPPGKVRSAAAFLMWAARRAAETQLRH